MHSCEYCNTKFNDIYVMQRHQRTAKYCLALQDKVVEKYYADMKKGMTSKHTDRKQIIGHICVIDNLKSRASKPGQRIEIQVPFNTGMDPYSGLFDLLMYEGAIVTGKAAWYEFGEGDSLQKFQKGNFRKFADAAMIWADTLNPNGVSRPLTDEEVKAALAENDDEEEVTDE